MPVLLISEQRTVFLIKTVPVSMNIWGSVKLANSINMAINPDAGIIWFTWKN